MEQDMLLSHWGDASGTLHKDTTRDTIQLDVGTHYDLSCGPPIIYYYIQKYVQGKSNKDN